MAITSRLIVAFMPAFPFCGGARRAIVCLGRGQRAAGSIQDVTAAAQFVLHRQVDQPLRRHRLIATNSAAICYSQSRFRPMIQETDVKFLVLATALLAPTLAFAQGAAPTTTQAQAPAPAAAPAPRAAKQPAAPKQAQTSLETLEITQVIGIRQIDPATYEIGMRLQNGKEVHLRANAFVMQNLGQLLGTYGK
jgi:hypothetical protein